MFWVFESSEYIKGTIEDDDAHVYYWGYIESVFKWERTQSSVK